MIEKYLTFDDVLLLPHYSEINLEDIDLKTKLGNNLNLSTPLVSAAMDTVTNDKMAIKMALNGGIGIIHKNMTLKEQVQMVKTVKEHNFLINTNCYTCLIEESVHNLKENFINYELEYAVILENDSVRGFITKRDTVFALEKKMNIKDIISKQKLVTAKITMSAKEVYEVMLDNSLTKLPIIDKDNKLVGVTTLKLLEESLSYTKPALDKNNNLIVGAAVSTTTDAIDRVVELQKAGIDVIVVDSAHGNSKRVIQLVKDIRNLYSDLDIIAGNVVTKDAIVNLSKAGATIIKVGIGSGSICTTRIISGVGAPQLSAIIECSKEAKKCGVNIIADGGVKYSGDIVKAIAAGADAVMLGSLLAGHEEAPGDKIINNNVVYKSFNGMGSLKAMQNGGGERYFQNNSKKFVPEGVEALIEYKGKVDATLYQLIGGMKSGFGYVGSIDINSLRKNARFVEITNAGKLESHPHSLDIVNSAPNYK